MADNTAIVTFDDALVYLRETMEAPEDTTPDIGFEMFIKRVSLPLILAERVSDQARASVGSWLVWGYEKYAKAKGTPVIEFCREVNDAMKELGRDDLVIPAVETLRGWYYQSIKPGTAIISDEDGFGLGAACNISDDPTGERALKLRAAAKMVHAETNMGAVTAARYLKRAYGGHNEQEWADGLPTFTVKESSLEALDGTVVPVLSVQAKWYDGTSNEVALIMDPEKHTGRIQIAARYIASLLRLKREEVDNGQA